MDFNKHIKKILEKVDKDTQKKTKKFHRDLGDFRCNSIYSWQQVMAPKMYSNLNGVENEYNDTTLVRLSQPYMPPRNIGQREDTFTQPPICHSIPNRRGTNQGRGRILRGGKSRPCT